MLQIRSIFELRLMLLKLGGAWQTKNANSTKVLFSFFGESFVDHYEHCARAISVHIKYPLA